MWMQRQGMLQLGLLWGGMRVQTRVLPAGSTGFWTKTGLRKVCHGGRTVVWGGDLAPLWTPLTNVLPVGSETRGDGKPQRKVVVLSLALTQLVLRGVGL